MTVGTVLAWIYLFFPIILEIYQDVLVQTVKKLHKTIKRTLKSSWYNLGLFLTKGKLHSLSHIYSKKPSHPWTPHPPPPPSFRQLIQTEQSSHLGSLRPAKKWCLSPSLTLSPLYLSPLPSSFRQLIHKEKPFCRLESLAPATNGASLWIYLENGGQLEDKSHRHEVSNWTEKTRHMKAGMRIRIRIFVESWIQIRIKLKSRIRFSITIKNEKL